MFGGSLLIAVAPTYAQAGLAGPAILVAARIFQGLSLGGEYGASATYLSEMAPRAHRGFWASFQYLTLIGGPLRSEEHTSELQSLMRISYAVFCLKKKHIHQNERYITNRITHNYH